MEGLFKVVVTRHGWQFPWVIFSENGTNENDIES